MIRLLILLIFFQTLIFGCTECAVNAPITHVHINIKADKTHIKTAKIRWEFTEAFTSELLKLYDINLDTQLDEKELKIVEESLLSYIEPKNYLSFISYSPNIEEKSRAIDVKKYSLKKDGLILNFQYEFDLNYPIIDKNTLYIRIEDDGGFFTLVFDEKKQLLRIPYKIKKERKYNSISFIIEAPALNNAIDVKQIDEAKNLIEKSIEKEELKEEVKQEVKTTSSLDKYVTKIKEYLVKIENGEDKSAIFLLLFFSFIYGVVHALGPGHGKALSFSYFSAQKSTYLTAFTISFFTAFIHIVGALVLVLISIFILQTILGGFIDNSILYITKVSAVLIMILSAYILYRKYKKESCACCGCSTQANKPMFSTEASKTNFVQNTKPSKIHFSEDRRKQDLFFVLTAGLIPCPGTVVLFVYAFILETYFSVFLAAIFISLGMGVVIFASSFLGVSVNKISQNSKKLTNIVEILAPIFMFILGLILFLNADVF
jgi:ABC-type nickel/cobalt efflux system permease component RcnA/ABC-type uncharacterized transport system substrate-binding protein